ncbi:MAG: RNA polymerase sigma factor [Crocinitomicaceae bacterium]|nr:RNA polymerase sigma factor [Crocinitomicaceae bacterium]
MKKKLSTYQEDKVLISAAKKDPRAFSALYEKYFEQIYIFIFKRLQDEEIAGDVCQDAMLKAWANLGKYEDRGFPFSAWLYRIASNEVNLFFRAQKKMVTVEIADTHVKTMMTELEIGISESESDQDKLLKVLSNLSPEHAEIVELRFFLQYSFKDIADFYGITEANAKMRLYRILEKIKKTWTANS